MTPSDSAASNAQTADNTPPVFQHVAIIGLGLIGGSLAKLIHREQPETTISAYDIAAETLQLASDDGVIQHTLTGLNDPQLAHAELIILAAHPHQTYADLATIAATWPQARVIDLGSSKQAICHVADTLAKPVDFIGGHPMGGREVSGYRHSDAAIFYNKRFLLTPCQSTSAFLEDAALKWLTQLHFQVRVMPPSQHDHWMALVSHFPQAYALILAKLLDTLGHDWPESPLAFAGGGLHDHIRLMGSSEAMWSNVFYDNHDALDAVLERVTEEIAAFRQALHDKDSLSPWFEASTPIYDDYYHRK